ncbi:MAG: response regulator transcription factor [Dehalococcoidia bacterium]
MVTTIRENSVCLLAPGGESSNNDEPPTADGPVILVVEDDTPTMRLERIILQEEGYQVTVVRSGEDALESLSNNKPSLILLDIGLPGLDGFDTCERIRQFSQIPIIMVTGRDCLEDKIKGMNVGADDYVTKPFLIHELSTRVKVLLRRSSQLVEPEPSAMPTAGDAAESSDPISEESPQEETPEGLAPKQQVSWTLNDNWTAPETTEPADSVEESIQDGVYEGTVRLMVESRGSIRQLMNFVGELRQNPQYRLLRLVANQHKEGMDVWLGLREPVSLKAQVLEMAGVASVETVTDSAPAENEHTLCVQLAGE